VSPAGGWYVMDSGWSGMIAPRLPSNMWRWPCQISLCTRRPVGCSRALCGQIDANKILEGFKDVDPSQRGPHQERGVSCRRNRASHPRDYEKDIKKGLLPCVRGLSYLGQRIRRRSLGGLLLPAAFRGDWSFQEQPWYFEGSETVTTVLRPQLRG